MAWWRPYLNGGLSARNTLGQGGAGGGGLDRLQVAGVHLDCEWAARDVAVLVQHAEAVRTGRSIVEDCVVFTGSEVGHARHRRRRGLVTRTAPHHVEQVATDGLADALLVLRNKQDLQLLAGVQREVLGVGEHLQQRSPYAPLLRPGHIPPAWQSAPAGATAATGQARHKRSWFQPACW